MCLLRVHAEMEFCECARCIMCVCFCDGSVTGQCGLRFSDPSTLVDRGPNIKVVFVSFCCVVAGAQATKHITPTGRKKEFNPNDIA
jgi:hypothetical protein